jgi:hypothetical protein
MGTLNFSGNTAISQLMFVDNRMYPGGPTVYLMEHYDSPINQMGNAGYIVANFFADATLVCEINFSLHLVTDLLDTAMASIRCMEQELSRHHSSFPLVPCFNEYVSTLNMLYLTILILLFAAMSIFVMYQISQPTASLWTETSVNFTLSYFSMSIARKHSFFDWCRYNHVDTLLSVNVFLTLLIAGRLLSMHNRVKQYLGAHHARTYTSVAAMMVECAVPYSALGLAFIITFALNSPAQNVILPVLSQVMVSRCLLR